MEFIQQNILYVAIAVFSGALTIASFLIRPAGRNSVSPNQATQLINREDAQVIDVREPDQYADGHLPESRNIPLDQLEARAGELDRLKDVPLILVCQTGTRSIAASKQLAKLGFAKVNNLAGGIAGWRAAGLPLRKGAKK